MHNIARFVDGSELKSRFAWISGVLTLALVLVVAFGIFLAGFSRRANESEIAQETHRVRAALSFEVTYAAQQLINMASIAPKPVTIQENLDKDLGERLHQSAWSARYKDDHTASIDLSSIPQTMDVGFISRADGVYLAASPQVSDGAKGDEAAAARIVYLQPIDGNFLAKISERAKVAGVRLASADESNKNQSVDLGLINNEDLVASTPQALSWAANRPGDTILLRYGIVLAFFAVILALTLAWQARRALEVLRKSESAVQRLAGFDSLSGLPNRIAFLQIVDSEIIRAERNHEQMAYFALDIYRLREVNDKWGHDTGDALIIAVSRIINDLLRPGDRFARMDGDEFALLQTEVSSPADSEELAHKIQKALEVPIVIDGKSIFVELAIGIAMSSQDADSRTELMNCAEVALVQAKLDRAPCCAFFEKGIGEAIRARRATENELRNAIEGGDLRVRYQPIMRIDGKHMVCVEALVRWQHPTRGLVPPDHFIGLAEERGLILMLGEWVLREACRAARNWPGLRVAVNVSPVQFQQKNFAGMVERVLMEEQLDPSQLELELTEGVIIADADQAENIIMDLRALGVRLALDDFGTGYSSLVYLRRFAIDKIKIDRSFLEAMESTGESAIIVHSIIHLGRALGLIVTAEGIETPEQHRFLQAAGAHELQGYLFSKPVSAEAITALYHKFFENYETTKTTLKSVA